MDTVRQIAKLEKRFSRHGYNGWGQTDFEILEGSIPVMISAPHTTNHLREGALKQADKMTGGLALYLHKTTGCHLIYTKRYSASDANYDSAENGGNAYQKALKEYVESHKIQVLIDLHGAADTREFAIEMGTAPLRDSDGNLTGDFNRSLHSHKFIARLIRYTFEFFFRDIDYPKKDVWQNRMFTAGGQNTVTKYISENTLCACIQLEINGTYRRDDLEDTTPLLKLSEGLASIVNTLGNIDWSAGKINAFRIWQSTSHKPQDKAELCHEVLQASGLNENALVFICSHTGATEMARLHTTGAGVSGTKDSEYLFLTNRLIENLFGREWIQGTEESAFLRGAPVVMYEEKTEAYSIGLPKANQIDHISFSSELYKSKSADCAEYDFVIFNRYCDSRLYIDFDKADYNDSGRVKGPDGKPAKKVMIPRYYKRLLGYLDTPLARIRDAEFQLLLQHIREESGPAACDTLTTVYKKIPGEIFYYLVPEIKNDEKYSQLLSDVYGIQRSYGMYDTVEVLKIPKKTGVRKTFIQGLNDFADNLIHRILKLYIGNVEYSLKSDWTSETDDKNNVARLSPNMMSLIGVAENDKIIVRFGNRKEILRVLAGEDMEDSIIGLPAQTRRDLGMNSVNDIIVVCRDMRHAFLRHSQEQTIAIIGTVLAVFEVTNNLLTGILLCTAFFPLILYFILNEERIKVK